MITGDDVLATARTQIDVPWMHQGRLWGQALDCAGLIICTARALALVPAGFDVNGYTRNPSGEMLRFCEQYMTRIQAPEVGAVVCIATDREPQHLGFIGRLGADWSVLHCSNAGRRVTVETRLRFGPLFRLRALYRLPGVEAPR